MPITNANVPRPPVQPVSQADLNAKVEAQARANYGRRPIPVEIDDNIIAAPLSQPGEEVILKDKSMEPRWVNYAVGDRQSTLQFSKMKASGFVVVKPEQVERGIEFYEINDGRIMNGDCILMQIKKSLYDGAKKWNWERAQRRRGKSMNRAAQDSVRAEINASGAPNSQLRKISTFVPSDVELGALVGSDKDVKS
jgi:hypothetical protein